MPKATLSTLALTKLSGSLLGPVEAAELGLRSLDAAATLRLDPSFRPLPSLLIPYRHPLTGGPLEVLPRWPAFYRLRYLVDAAGAGLAAFTDQTKLQRYAQPPGSGAAAYFPSLKAVSWPQLCQDPTQPLIITEGELKAACACKQGFPAIGLGGVWNFRAAGLGLMFLRELELVSWVRRPVHIVFDSDVRRNPDVVKALVALADELVQRGALPYLALLPDLRADGKTGLDDYLVAAEAAGLRRLLAAAPPLTLAQPLWDLNSKVVYVRDPGLIIDLGTGARQAPRAFVDHHHAPLDVPERVLKGEGEVSMKKVSAAAAWLRWPLRHEASRLTYAPGAPRRTAEGAYNTWPGWGTQPQAGTTVQPFLDLIDHLFTRAEPAAKTWFLRWCAYPLQHPGTKLFSCAVLYGTRHGTGKSLLGYTLGKIYGKNFTEITAADLHSNFNEWAEGKQLVMGDDVTGSNRRADADLLKKLITQQLLRVNQKYVPSYTVPDVINYFFTSNHPDAFFLEDDDRRFFVHEITVGPLPEEFYASYDLWLATPGAAAAVFAWLLKQPLGDFNPAAPAYKTAARSRMIADVRSDLGDWAARLRDDPDGVLRVGEVRLTQDLYTNRELLAVYDPTGRTGVTPNGLGRELRRAGIAQAALGSPIRYVTDEPQERYYIVRHQARWLLANHREVARYLQEVRGEEKKHGQGIKKGQQRKY